VLNFDHKTASLFTKYDRLVQCNHQLERSLMHSGRCWQDDCRDVTMSSLVRWMIIMMLLMMLMRWSHARSDFVVKSTARLLAGMLLIPLIGDTMQQPSCLQIDNQWTNNTGWLSERCRRKRDF